MLPIPAIDLKDGKVVRLLQGDFKEEKIYPAMPEETARRFEEAGASRIHVVDLDGALGGEPRNAASIEKILKKTAAAVEVGGGIRTLENIGFYLGMGARWVVLGTRASLDSGFLRESLKEFGEKIIVGIDARDGLVATDGWTKVTSTRALDLAKSVETLGGRTIIYTDISRDGALKGPNLKAIGDLSGEVALQVIASGGVATLGDLEALMALKRKNLTGVIIGKALYENKFKLEEAIRTCLPNG
ncbi:MAG: 1-(5-phosphoribosyl)-5-[(5-phosphoribosylamino)methylideneamino]imidazole-4-carboxamide isomerase [Candidatus Omnitrophica bacterium]|nr:1-(5-phosphoribosyl)-5-[(5-phosphoribosylamino)methylideneamino]imidazole-4-carboxamide isomerase [Candidatus Omnitrophota bacterium]